MKIKPATENKVAVIKLTADEKARFDLISPEVFVSVEKFPSGLNLKVSKNETLSETAQSFLKGDILKTE